MEQEIEDHKLQQGLDLEQTTEDRLTTLIRRAQKYKHRVVQHRVATNERAAQIAVTIQVPAITDQVDLLPEVLDLQAEALDQAAEVLDQAADLEDHLTEDKEHYKH